MAESVVVALLAAPPVVGFVSRRWLTLLLPLLGWPLYYVGLHWGWWGYGTGDGWGQVAGALMVTGLATTAFAVVLAGRPGRRRPISGRDIR